MKPVTLVVLGAILGAGLAVGFQKITSDTSDDAPLEPVAATEVATAVVEQRDLTFVEESVATLEFVDSVTVAAPSSGTVTSLVEDGGIIARGSIVATIDGAPVVALYGDVPGWRDLDTSSSDGADIYQLELNLVALGFDPDAAIEIDQTYDYATENAVERWQEALGLEPDGDVPQSLIAYIPGELLIDSAASTVGINIQKGGSLVVGRVLSRSFGIPTTGTDERMVSNVLAIGEPVETGTVLFQENGYPVVAVEGDFATTPLLDRDLSQASGNGSDVELLEQALAAAGFAAADQLVVDNEFDLATSQAVFDWYSSLGFTSAGPDSETFDPENMTVPAGSFVVIPSGLMAGENIVGSGQNSAPVEVSFDQLVLVLTTPSRLISTTAPLGDDTFAVGATMQVEFPDGTLTEGTVVRVGTTAQNASGTPGATPLVPIQIATPAIPESASGFVEIPVTLRVTTQTIRNALVVPVTALIALSEGGYALEIVDSSTSSHLVSVEPGTFQDGFVEVAGDALGAGVTVVVAS